ncbi:hypothetical protein [Streptomyces sp. LUP30]|uniref:hypothetical protein n=1 Tax=Streptomyces sp. LUP30 TaxID=1890285 RepID=UPI000851E26E|nr:hypothetical protein [Streptomyces sp. LUP30]
MSTGHRAEAERHLSQGAFVSSPETQHPVDPVATDFHLRMAQVHATLAAGETGAADVAAYRHTIQTMRFALIRHIADGLAHSESDEAHQHARGLAQYLDSVGLNVDREVDAHNEELFGAAYAHAVWESPSVRRAKRDAEPLPF